MEKQHSDCLDNILNFHLKFKNVKSVYKTPLSTHWDQNKTLIMYKWEWNSTVLHCSLINLISPESRDYPYITIIVFFLSHLWSRSFIIQMLGYSRCWSTVTAFYYIILCNNANIIILMCRLLELFPLVN